MKVAFSKETGLSPYKAMIFTDKGIEIARIERKTFDELSDEIFRRFGKRIVAGKDFKWQSCGVFMAGYANV